MYLCYAYNTFKRPSKTLQNKYDRQNKKVLHEKGNFIFFTHMLCWHASIKFWILWPSVLFISGFLLWYIVLLLFTITHTICVYVCVFLRPSLSVLLIRSICYFSSFNLTLQLLNKALFYYKPLRLQTMIHLQSFEVLSDHKDISW